jgi:ABC-type transporter Mla MlaB component
MSKESSGLLSKMAKFVRNPRTDWADLDSAEAARADLEEEASKAQLREMLERKRQNDFVRKREFDALRKLRNKETDVPQAMHSPSFFPSSSPAESEGEKQNTLEKIAAIEAQMASQWFRSQGAALKASRAAALKPEEPTGSAAAIDPTAFAPTQTMDVPSSARAVPTAPSTPVAPVFAAQPAPAPTPVAQLPLLDGDLLLPAGMRPAYESSQFEVAELVNNPEVEEIAILYANGETASAEESLLRLISPTGGYRENAESWMALFDLYRATGQHSRFDEAGIEFAAVFGRSAPVWYSLPELLLETGASTDEVPEQAAAGNASSWTANSTVSLQNLALLDTLPQRVAPPWRLDFRYMKRIDPGCGQKLAQRLNAWASDPQVKLRVLGGEHALQLMEELTPVADASVPQELWQLRLALMRLMGQMDDFELNALNFCVTYEVSPPAWEAPRAECLQMSPDGQVAEVQEEAKQPVTQAARTELPDTHIDSAVARAKLTGQVLGDASSQFGELNEVDGVAETIEVDCRHVQRVDFVAAGTLLNWVSDHQSKGQSISFENVNRLVAIFFRIIGIRELATVNVRKE